jgi:hypothetical protein
MSGHPSPPPFASLREEPRATDSRSYTLPGPHSIPRLIVDPSDLSWFEIQDEKTRNLVPLIDGQRSVLRIAKDQGIPPREAQLRIADLLSRGVVEV